VVVVPFAVTLVSAAFALLVLRQFAVRRRAYQLVWGAALAMFSGAGLIEALEGVWGWSPAGYRLYYLLGGILTVGWLGVGTTFLLSPRRVGPYAGALMTIVSLAAIPAVMVAPVNEALLRQAEPGRGAIGNPAALLAPITNSLGSIALIGGAAWSAWAAWRRHAPPARVLGVAMIAAGAFAAAATHGVAGQLGGYHALASLGELAGAALMFAGYLVLEAPQRVRGEIEPAT
jgi:hypothetical protein